MDEILNLVGRCGGIDESYWKIVAEIGQGTTDYFPAIDETGRIKPFHEWNTLEEYIKHKVRKTRLTVRYAVIGNALAAEEEIRTLLDCHCMSVAPNTIDVYYATDNPIPDETAGTF